jgi:prepilin-type N-terminal cleavage/methylation domain-containing protein
MNTERGAMRQTVCGIRQTACGIRPTAYGRRRKTDGGFSLIEVTVAIGIFAFVAVGILGLLPAALKQRADSSRETRAVLIAEELFATLQAANSITNVVFRDGPKLEETNSQKVNLLSADGVVVGYPPQTSVPFYLWGGDRARDTAGAWVRGVLPPDALPNNIEALAKMSAAAVTNSPGLYRVTVEVRAPANVPLTNTPTVSFSTLAYLP